MVPALDFDPNRDAARIETAIKTKGKTQYCTPLLKIKKERKSARFWNLSTDESLVFVSQHLGSECFDHAGNTSKSVLAGLCSGHWLGAVGSSRTTNSCAAHHFVLKKNTSCVEWCFFTNEGGGGIPCDCHQVLEQAYSAAKPSYICVYSLKCTLTQANIFFMFNWLQTCCVVFASLTSCAK